MTNNARPRQTPGAGRRMAGRAAIGAVAAPLALLAIAGPASAAGLGFDGALDDDGGNKADLVVDALNDGTLDLAGLDSVGGATDILDTAGGVASVTDLLGLGSGLGGGMSVTDDLDSGAATDALGGLGVLDLNTDHLTERPLASLDLPGNLPVVGGLTGGGPLDALGGGDIKQSKLDAAVAIDLDSSNNKTTVKADSDDANADDESTDSTDATDGAVTDGTDSVSSTAGGLLTGADLVSGALGGGALGGGALGGLF